MDHNFIYNPDFQEGTFSNPAILQGPGLITLLLSLYGILIGFPIPIVIALILNELHGRFKKTVQTILYAPHFISTVVLVGMVNMLFSPTTGIVNHFLNTFLNHQQRDLDYILKFSLKDVSINVLLINVYLLSL